MPKKFTLADAVDKGIQVHGKLYEYIEMIEPVAGSVIRKISYRCTRCGANIIQSMSLHLHGHGCPKCSKKLKHSRGYDE